MKHVLQIFLLLVFSISTLSGFSGAGSGSEEDPYQITTLEQLQEMNDGLEAHYILVNDIDAGETEEWNDGAGFMPVGDSINPFTGSFNGNYYTITGLRIHTKEYGGLFGCLHGENVVVQNLYILDADVICTRKAGILAGMNQLALIRNIKVFGDVTGMKHTGGLVGINYGTIEVSCADVSVISDQYVGGLVGLNYGTISNTYSLRWVQGSFYIGGHTGYNNYGEITNSYSKARVTGDEFTGGFTSTNTGTMQNYFWDIDSAHVNKLDKGAALETYLMKDKGTYTDVGWDFDDIWAISPDINNGYPYFQFMYPSGVEDEEILSAIKIYPNPANSFIKINSKELIINSIEIIDIQGREINHIPGTKTQMYTISIENLRPGFYYVRIELNHEYKFYPLIIE